LTEPKGSTVRAYKTPAKRAFGLDAVVVSRPNLLATRRSCGFSCLLEDVHRAGSDE
jgi:hypothetical protein